MLREEMLKAVFPQLMAGCFLWVCSIAANVLDGYGGGGFVLQAVFM